jgi:hypothetical protein
MDQVRFRCHKCRALLELPAANAGKKFRCPECLSVGVIPAASETGIQGGQPPVQVSQAVVEELFGFRAEDAPAPAQEPTGTRRFRDDDDQGGPRSGKSSRRRKLGEIREEREDDAPDTQQVRAALRGWRKVRLGISIIYIAFCVWVGTILLYFAMIPLLAVMTNTSVAAGVANPGQVNAEQGGCLFVILTFFVGGIGFLVNLATIVGYCFCLFVPPRTGAIGWAIGTLALALLTLGSSFFGFIFPPLQLVTWLLGFSQWMTFLLFLRAVGVALDVSWLVKSIQGLLLLGVGGMGTWVGGMVLSFVFLFGIASKGRPPDAADSCFVGIGLLVAGVVLLLLLIIILIRYLRVLRDTAAQIEEELAQRRQVLGGAAGYSPKG